MTHRTSARTLVTMLSSVDPAHVVEYIHPQGALGSVSPWQQVIHQVNHVTCIGGTEGEDRPLGGPGAWEGGGMHSPAHLTSR